MPSTPPTDIIVYNSSSFGGCYDYVLELGPALARNQRAQSTTVVVTRDSASDDPTLRKLLVSDIPPFQGWLGRKLYFFWRILVNPLLFWLFLLKRPGALVVFNDFEQLTAPLWVPLYHLLRYKHDFAIILHDPDRDAYPPNQAYARWSMRIIVNLCRLALYHEFLPQKPYYSPNNLTEYRRIPHGIYPAAPPDIDLVQEIVRRKNSAYTYLSILGNIREEKNYELVIRALAELPDVALIVAGQKANQEVDTIAWHHLAEELGVTQRIIWVERYLSHAELSSMISVSDVVLLYYSSTFTSQSGILNTIASFKKTVVVSDGPSSLAASVRQFDLGLLVEPDSLPAFTEAIQGMLAGNYFTPQAHWDTYMEYASWDRAASIILEGQAALGQGTYGRPSLA